MIGKKYLFLSVVVAATIWWVVPSDRDLSEFDLASLGPSTACACAAALSPPLEKWKGCAVGALKTEGRIQDIIVPRSSYRVQPTTQMLPKNFETAIGIAEAKCGKFDAAWAQAKSLQERRIKVGYEEYEIVDLPETLFAGMALEDFGLDQAMGSK